jgi:hypothetical protein
LERIHGGMDRGEQGAQIVLLVVAGNDEAQFKRFFVHKSDSMIPAIFIWCFNNPVFNGSLPWIGITMRSRQPSLIKMWCCP